MPCGVRKKLWRQFTSLFRRRRRKYDVIAAANQDNRPFDFEAGTEESIDFSMTGNNHPLINGYKIPFFRCKTYKVAATESLDDQRTPALAGSYNKTVLFVKKCQPQGNTTNEKYVAALYEEGMLQWPYDSRNPTDPLCVPEVYDHPVLAVCHGFRDKELRENRRRPNQRQQVPPSGADSFADSWIQSGINLVLIDDLTEEEPRVDDIPFSMWLSVIEPALHTIMTYRLGRSSRLNITTRRKQTPLNSLHLSTVGGDTAQHELFQGPHNNHWALGLVAVFTMRIGELGERQVRHRDIISDIQIPELNSKTRQRNRNRTRVTRTASVTRDSETD